MFVTVMETVIASPGCGAELLRESDPLVKSGVPPGTDVVVVEAELLIVDVVLRVEVLDVGEVVVVDEVEVLVVVRVVVVEVVVVVVEPSTTLIYLYAK